MRGACYAWFHSAMPFAQTKIRQTVLYAQAGDLRLWDRHERDSFMAEVEFLAVLHNGSVDTRIDRAAVVHFDEPGACIRMAMDLQRSAGDLRLCIGVHTETGLAAQESLTAASGSIAIAPEIHALVKGELEADSAACLVMEEFHESGLARVCLTPAPAQGGPELSTFAGLGRL